MRIDERPARLWVVCSAAFTVLSVYSAYILETSVRPPEDFFIEIAAVMSLVLVLQAALLVFPGSRPAAVSRAAIGVAPALLLYAILRQTIMDAFLESGLKG